MKQKASTKIAEFVHYLKIPDVFIGELRRCEVGVNEDILLSNERRHQTIL